MSDECFVRTRYMVGEAGLRRLQAAHVVVVGLGAVGSYAVEGLARAGVGRLRLVDFDTIRPSNINRQLYALQSTLGQAKAAVAAERAWEINPHCAVEPLEMFCHTDTLDTLLAGAPDVVIDAIDSCNPKIELLAAAVERRLAIASSMGAALRTDPARVRTGLLSEVSHCPLARRMRKGLRRRGISIDIPCVYSDEPVDTGRVFPPDVIPADENEYRRGRRRRTLGSFSTITGIFGLTVAHLAIRMILGELFPAVPGDDNGEHH